MNKLMKPSRIFSHAGLHHSSYMQLEFYVEIMCALANMTAADPPAPAPLPKSGERFAPSHVQRLRFFASLYAPSPYPSNLLQLNPVPPMWCVVPAQEHHLMWREILAAFPDKEAVLTEALLTRATEILHVAERAEYFPEHIDYHSAQWTHKYLDHRARALISAHYVLLVQYCMATQRDGRFAYVVQATVHASQRSHRRHFPRIIFDALPPPKPFRWHSAACSCENGCVLIVSVHSADSVQR